MGFNGLPIVNELLAADLFSFGATIIMSAISLRDSASGDGLDILVITKDGTEEFTESIK
jgi:20S proteasome alpha/beta subunit